MSSEFSATDHTAPQVSGPLATVQNTMVEKLQSSARPKKQLFKGAKDMMPSKEISKTLKPLVHQSASYIKYKQHQQHQIHPMLSFISRKLFKKKDTQVHRA